MPTIIIAHEFYDALPVLQFQVCPVNLNCAGVVRMIVVFLFTLSVRTINDWMLMQTVICMKTKDRFFYYQIPRLIVDIQVLYLSSMKHELFLDFLQSIFVTCCTLFILESCLFSGCYYISYKNLPFGSPFDESNNSDNSFNNEPLCHLCIIS